MNAVADLVRTLWRRTTFVRLAVALSLLPAATAAQPSRPPRLDSLENAFARATTDSARVEALYTMGQVWRHANVDSARACAERALTLSRRASFHRGEAMALNLLGLCDFWQENYAEAVIRLDEARSLAEPLGDPQLIASVLVNQGLVRKALGDLPGALALYQRQWSVSESAGDRLGQARAGSNIGLLFRELGNEQEAMVHLRRSLAIATALQDRQGMAITSSNVAVGLRKLGRSDSARFYFAQALSLNTALGNERFRATNLLGLADVALDEGDRAAALEHLRAALTIRERSGNRSEIAEVLLRLARALGPAVEEDAIAHARAALTIGEQARLPNVRSQACLALGELLQRGGKDQEAAAYFARHIALRDSLTQEEAVGAVARQQVVFDVARKEQRMQELARQEAEQRDVAMRRTRERDRVLLILVALLLVIGVVGVLYFRIRRLNRALETARSAAERNEQAMDRFLSIMGHEVRSPMAAAIASLDRAADPRAPGDRDRYVAIAGRSMRGLLRIVNDLLDRSAIEAGTLRIEHITLVPLEVIEQAVRPFEALAASKGLHLDVQLHPALNDRRIGDPGRLAQVITNLLGNAVKYTDQGEVAMHAMVDNDPFISIRITDTGRGMSEEQRRRLFAPFHRLETSGRNDPGGTGLGLYITAMLVQHMGGSIDVASALGKGTTFRVNLPMPRTATQEPGVPVAFQGPGAYYVVDDDPADRQRLETLLKSIDPSRPVLQAGDGRQLIDLLAREEETPGDAALLFTDLDMPHMTGFELVRAVKEGRHAELCCVAVSSSVLMMDDAELRALGFTAVLPKPVDEVRLRSLLQALS